MRSAAFCLPLIVAGTAPALAQMEELVVEAQRREQSIQDVPLAVSGFGAQDIERLQINETADIGVNVPNLQTYEVTANGAAMQVHARGASVQNPGFNVSESPVGLYVDDVYHGRLATANLDLNDIERIEVLRGPQATLYGRNTIAGAIKAYTRTPGDELWADGSIGYGKYDTARIAGSIGGPISAGSLAGSVAALYHDRDDGYLDNPASGDNPGEYKNWATRGKLHYYGADRLEATLTLWALEAENDGYNGIPYTPFPFIPADSAAAAAGSPLCGFYCNNTATPDANYGDTDQHGLTLDWTWHINPDLDFRSITGYADIDDEFGFDIAGGGLFVAPGIGPFDGLLVTSSSTMETFSQEFQLLGQGDSFEWIVGLYYLNEDGDQDYAGDVPGVFGFRELSASDTTSYAVYAEGTWRFSGRWSLTAGGRWTRDDKEYDLACTGDCTPTEAGDPFISIDQDWDEFTPRVSFNYDLGDNVLVYASVAKGFQAGGFQTLCFGNLQCGEQTYDPQTVWSYELGFKGDLFDERLRLNTAAFYAQYKDIQQTVPRVDSFGNASFPTENVDDVDVWGIEAEANWIPAANLNVFAHFGWMDADDVNFMGDFGPGKRELPSNPDWTGGVGFDYTLSLLTEIDLFFGADLYYSDEYFNDVNNALLIDDYTRVNGFVGIGRPDGRWQLVGEWKNLGNDQDNVSGLLVPGTTNIRTVLPPLEYLVTLRVRYR